MKTKLISVLIGLVVVGAILLSNFADLAQGKPIMPILFLCFFGLIVAVQIVPAILLFKALLGELIGSHPKIKAEATGDVPPGDAV